MSKYSHRITLLSGHSKKFPFFIIEPKVWFQKYIFTYNPGFALNPVFEEISKKITVRMGGCIRSVGGLIVVEEAIHISSLVYISVDSKYMCKVPDIPLKIWLKYVLKFWKLWSNSSDKNGLYNQHAENQNMPQFRRKQKGPWHSIFDCIIIKNNTLQNVLDRKILRP